MGDTSTTTQTMVKPDREKELVDLQQVLVRVERIDRHAQLEHVTTPPVDAIWMAQKLKELVGDRIRDIRLITKLDEQLQLFHQGQGVLALGMRAEAPCSACGVMSAAEPCPDCASRQQQEAAAAS